MDKTEDERSQFGDRGIQIIQTEAQSRKKGMEKKERKKETEQTEGHTRHCQKIYLV